MQLSRRNFVAASGAALAAPAILSSTARAHPALLNVSDPVDRLRAMVRLRASETIPSWLLVEGDVYGREPDTLLKPLFRFTNILRIEYTKVSDTAYTFRQRESAHYTNLETGEPLGEFYNPYMDKTNIGVGFVSPIFYYKFDIKGTTSDKQPDHRGDLPHELTERAGYFQSTERRYLDYPSALDLNKFPASSKSTTRYSVDIATYRAPIEEVLDTSVDLVNSSVDFVADTEWPYWMFMGDTPGSTWWLGHGSKYREKADLPSDVAARIDRVHPGFLDDPWGIDRTPFRTDVQMEKLRAEGKI